MFSAAIELILNVAYREATVRRHTHLTLEHLLYVLAHDPEGEKILTACGADLPALRHSLDTFLDGLEQSKKGRQREPQQTLAFQRVLQTAVLHVQSAGKDEVRFGDVLAAILQQPNSYAAELLQSQDITRLDVLNYISHGITKAPAGKDEPRSAPAPAGPAGDGPAPSRDPLSAFAVNLTDRARQGRLDPLIGRRDELRRTLQILCRRRKNNPVFVGDAGVGKTALAEGLARRLLDDDVPARLEGAEIFALDTAALLAGTRFRGDFEERFKAVVDALAGRPLPILFIDEVHATVGAGATTGGTMDLAMLIKPLLAAGDLRLIGSTTFDEFKQIERDRGLARRLQRVVLEEPSVDETVEILTGLRSRYEEHHRGDVHRRRPARRRQAGPPAPARLAAAGQRHRRARRGGRGHRRRQAGRGGRRDGGRSGGGKARAGPRRRPKRRTPRVTSPQGPPWTRRRKQPLKSGRRAWLGTSRRKQPRRSRRRPTHCGARLARRLTGRAEPADSPPEERRTPRRGIAATGRGRAGRHVGDGSGRGAGPPAKAEALADERGRAETRLTRPRRRSPGSPPPTSSASSRAWRASPRSRRRRRTRSGCAPSTRPSAGWCSARTTRWRRW